MQNFQIPLNLQRWAQVPAFCPALPRASPACARLHPRGLGWKARDTSASGFYSPPGPGAQFCTFNFPFLNCELICCAKKEKFVMSLAANPKPKERRRQKLFPPCHRCTKQHLEGQHRQRCSGTGLEGDSARTRSSPVPMAQRGRGSKDPSFTLSCRTQHFAHRQHSQGEPLSQGSPAMADKITLSFFRSFSLF